MDDLERIKIVGMGNIDVTSTVSSALDIFGGNLRYKDVIWHDKQAAAVVQFFFFFFLTTVIPFCGQQFIMTDVGGK